MIAPRDSGPPTESSGESRATRQKETAAPQPTTNRLKDSGSLIRTAPDPSKTACGSDPSLPPRKLPEPVASQENPFIRPFRELDRALLAPPPNRSGLPRQNEMNRPASTRCHAPPCSPPRVPNPDVHAVSDDEPAAILTRLNRYCQDGDQTIWQKGRNSRVFFELRTRMAGAVPPTPLTPPTRLRGCNGHAEARAACGRRRTRLPDAVAEREPGLCSAVERPPAPTGRLHNGRPTRSRSFPRTYASRTSFSFRRSHSSATTSERSP